MDIYVPQGAAPAAARLIRDRLDRIHADSQIMMGVVSARTSATQTHHY